MEITISNWYYLSNGKWYLYYDEDTQTLKRTYKIDYYRINNFLFNVIVENYLEHPNLYVNLYDYKYSKIPVFKLVCKAVPNKYILPFSWDKNSKFLPNEKHEISLYTNAYWIFADYVKWFEYDTECNKQMLDADDLDIQIGNLVYINRENNHILGLDCTAEHNDVIMNGYKWRDIRFQHASNETIQYYTNNIEVNINTEYVIEENNIIYIFSTNVNMNTVNDRDIIHITTQKNNF